MVETEETEKFVIAKPVPCRPFAVKPSVPARCYTNSVGSEASKEIPEPKVILPSNSNSNVIYKPIAKLVSKTTIAFLANLGGDGISPAARAITQPSNHQAHHPNDLTTSNTHRDNSTPENREDNDKVVANNTDRLASYDGHNWRKYGQKLVKGSEFPRSYYKCSHTNCPVKKKVEKTLDGRIAEIVYKGEHNHPQSHDYNYDAAARNEVKTPNQIENENNIESSGQSNFSVSIKPTNDHFAVANSNSSLAFSGECEEVSESLEVEFKSKRTKRENQLSKNSSTAERGSPEPQIVVEKNNDSGTTGDGFRWRKYGQKVVKGKIYPRSYYRCTSPKCNVRKYVERMSEDPNNFISTYEGKHNHNNYNSATNPETSKNTRTNPGNS